MGKMNSFCKFLFYYYILAELCLSTEAMEVNKDLIDNINKMNTTWEAGENEARIPPKFGNRRELKQSPKKRPKNNNNNEKRTMPNFFDSRNRWRFCESILNRVRDQGFCDSGWAVSTASMISDRTCIHSKGETKHHLSAHELMTCCKACYPQNIGACEGGSPEEAINYFVNSGLVTGGEVDSHEGCQPYDKIFYDGRVVKNCTETCTNHHETVKRVKGETGMKELSGEHDIRHEIWNNGPVVSEIDVYEDLYYYRRGVYVHKLGAKLGVHWLKIIGWGARDNERYWVVMNSHGTGYGERGAMKFKRGVSDCGIEDKVLTIKSPVGGYERHASVHETTSSRVGVGGPGTSGGVAIRPSCGKCVLVEVLLLYSMLCMYT